MADAVGPSVTVLYLHKGKQSAGESSMFFFAPPMIAGMQTGLLIAVGMQAMMLPKIPPTPKGSGSVGSESETGEASQISSVPEIGHLQ